LDIGDWGLGIGVGTPWSCRDALFPIPNPQFPLPNLPLSPSVRGGFGYSAGMEAGLYVVGTPIGNLRDITLRALDTLREADLVLAEDTRQTGKLCARHTIDARLMSYHKFNEASRTHGVIERIRAGAAVALVTDSGMPAVSDPGARLVAACREAGVPVTAVPGPSAVTTAVALAGCRETAFRFEGFLPVKSGGRRRRLETLADADCPVVLYESPHRLIKLLHALQECLPERTIFVGRELTKKFEECRSGTPAELLAAYAGRAVKGELVVVLSPAARR